MTTKGGVPTLQKRATIKGESVLYFDNAPNNSYTPVELLTIPETAEFLKISKSGVQRLYQGRHLPFIKVGGSVRFLKSDLLAYLQQQRVESIG